ncbi:MAG: hypothetical protein WBG42_09025 [Cryomorphaceae bacterium]
MYKIHKKLRLIALGLLATALSISCMCPPPKTGLQGFDEAFDRVSDVFVAEVVMIDTLSLMYVVEVIEVFKGDLKKSDKVLGRNHWSCYPNIDRYGKWIIFGEDGIEFSTEQCGLTFNLDSTRILTPPPPAALNQSTADYMLVREDWKRRNEELGKKVVQHFRDNGE